MRKYYLIFYIAFFMCEISAQEKFDCHNINRRIVLSKYYSLKHLGADYITPTGAEVVPMLLTEIFDDGDVRQVCIDAAYKNYQIGNENQYRWYKEYIQNISEDDFYRNYDYLMIFQELIFTLERTTNYKRQRKRSSYSYNSSNSSNVYYAGIYRVLANKNNFVYFYRTPNLNDRKNAYFTSSELVEVKAVQNGFGYVEFVNNRNQKSTGWIRLSEMKKQ